MRIFSLEYQKRQEKQLYGVSKTPSGRMQVPPGNNFHTLPLPHKDKKKKKKMSFVGPEVNGHVKITSTFSYQADVEMRETKKAQQAILIPKVRESYSDAESGEWCNYYSILDIHTGFPFQTWPISVSLFNKCCLAAKVAFVHSFDIIKLH